MSWQERFQSVLVGATVASAATSGTATVLSQLQVHRPAAALNATSHIVWGEEAAEVDSADSKHTLTGAALNAGAMLSWALVFELLPRTRSLPSSLAKGALVAAMAYVTDYYIVPRRLTPGFEKRLTGRALGSIYAAMATSLGIAAWHMRCRS